MNYIFEVTDKTGRKIRLTKRQWKHIMRRHPYMEKYLEEIKATIQIPDKITERPYNKCYYYKNYKHFKPPNRFILVIVRYLNGEGFVISTYLEDKIK